MQSASSDGARVIPFVPRPGREGFVTKDELARHLQVSCKTIERHVAAGMPCLHAGKRSPRFRVSDVEEWLREQP
jgi:phage terminase Nu1 subunit (DNA packaging protein)